MSKDTLHSAAETLALRDAFGRFATGVAVVTARDSEGLLGLPVNSFASASLSPPLLMFSISRKARCLDRLRAAPGFAVNVLGAHQQALSDRFSGRGPDKWNMDVETLQGAHGAPLLVEVLASFECRPYARHEAGDHMVFIGEVLRFETAGTGEPLLYYRGGYRALEG